MGGLDDLVDDVDEEKEKEEVEGLMDELGIEDKEELEELETKLDRVQTGLIHYDKQMERLERRISVLEGAVANLIKELSDVSNTDIREQDGDGDEQSPTTEGSQNLWDTEESGDESGLNF